MQRLLAVLLILIGLIGLALGRLGETTWAPATETTATVDLADPGSAVVIDPGVLYVGGEEGEAVIEGASDVSVITAANGDIEAYLEDVRYTRITGASDWTTLSTQEVNPDGAAELSDPTGSDLWRSVDTQPSPYTLDVADFWAGENGENEQVYRSLLIVTDGSAPGAEQISITWPVEAENEWVPFAYAGGAAIAVIGLVLLMVSLGGGRRRDEDELAEAEDAPAEPTDASGPVAAAGAVGAADDADTAADESAPDPAADPDGDPVADPAAAPADEPDPAEDPLLGAPGQDLREESVWSPADTSSDDDTPADDDAPADADAPADDDTLDVDRTEPIRLFGDEEERR